MEDRAAQEALEAEFARRVSGEIDPEFPVANVEDLIDHIDYVADRFGVDYLAIGTDNPYTSAAAIDQKMPGGAPSRTRWEALWPADDPLFAPEWKKERQKLSMAWTNWPLFTIGLVQRGYVDEEIRKIIGGNFLRVAQEAWPD